MDAETAPSWRAERRKGMLGIAVTMLIAAVMWFAIRNYVPVPEGMEELGARLAFTVKCAVVAVLFTLLMATEAVAHERLRSPAFDPLGGFETGRMRVNQRNLQNTLEQTVIFLTGLFGLAVYSSDGNAMRAVLATTVVWIVSRLGFWIGYHISSTWRVLGAPSLLLAQLVLIYVAMRVGGDIAGDAGLWGMLVAVLVFEAVLFATTRPLPLEGPKV
jgi:hypothetical protein